MSRDTSKKKDGSSVNLAIAKRFREVIDAKFASQAELAHKLDIQRQTLNQYLRGRSRPGTSMQDKLRDLGVDVEYIMTGVPATPSKLDVVPIGLKLADRARGLLLTKFDVDRKYDADKVAGKMGMSSRELRRIISGQKSFPVEFLLRLAEVTRDLDFLQPLFSDSHIQLCWSDDVKK